MKNRMVAILLGIILVFSLTACTGSKDKENSTGDGQTSISDNIQDTDNSGVSTEELSGTETDNLNENESEETFESESSSLNEQEETSGPETGNFQGLEVEEDIEINIEDGEVVVIE